MIAGPGPLRIFAVSPPGLEAVLAAEARALPGARGAVAVTGGVELGGDEETVWRANLWLRTATRVLVRLGEVRARDFARLRREAARLPWERCAAGPVRLRFTVTSRRSRLYHTGAVAERLAGAAAERLSVTEDPAAPLLHLVVRGEEDVFLVSADSSGAPLHRRGYRQETAKAPLRETLAAGVLALAGWDPATPLVDPACGSGTLVLEAALLALGRAPGARRDFAFQHWPGFDARRWDGLLAEAAAHERPAPAALLGYDVDAGAVETARRNAARGGLDRVASFAARDIDEATLPPGPPGLVVANAPYGLRVRSRGGTLHLMRGLGRLVRRAPGWRLAVLAADARPARATGLDLQAMHPLVTGGVRVTLLVLAPSGSPAGGGEALRAREVR